jgi:hypothetical protein
MIDLLSLLSAAAVAAAPPPAAPSISLTPAARRDVQCFILYAVAVAGAEAAKEEKTKVAGSIGLAYFFGKLKAEVPGLDLADAVQQEANAIDSDTKSKEIGTACDSEFQKGGAELLDLGRKLQELGAKPIAS